MTDETASVLETGNAADADAEAVTQPVDTAPAQATTSPASSGDWKSSLPEEIRDSPSLSKFETIEGLAKSYVNAEKMIGADKIVVPKEGDEDGYKAAMVKLGLPETPDAYGFKAPEKVPDGLQYSEDVDKRLAGILHGAHVPARQAAKIRDELMTLVAEGGLMNLEQSQAEREAAEKAVEQAEEALRRDWGQAYEQRGKMAYKAAEANFSEETMAALDAAGLTNNPAFVKDLYSLGVKVQGEKALLGEVESEQSPADMDAAIAKFEMENKDALLDPSHPAHATAVKQRNTLYEKRWR